MQPFERATKEGQKYLDALQRKIRQSGRTLRDVEGKLGTGRDYLRHLLSGRLEIKLKHVLGILAVLEVPPAEFFGEIYGLVHPDSLPGEPIPPQFAVANRKLETGAVWFIARKLQEEGIIGAEEVAAWVAEWERGQAEF
ncbi:MAG: helix-turn-helix domain-containing protein [Gemmatimonadales bacterium]